MTELTLYTHPMSRGRIARWMLEEVGQPYEVEVLDYVTTMKAADYLALNPMGKVPTLVHGSSVVSECAAVVTYLAETFPEAGLLPADRGKFLQRMFFAAGPVEHAVTNRALGFTPPAEKSGMVGYGDFERMMAVLETWVGDAPYLCGDRFSAADVYLGSQIGYGLRFGSMPETPALRAYYDRVSQRPALLRATAADDALMPAQ